MLLISFLESFAFLGLIIPGTSLVVFAGVLTSRKIIRLGSLIVAVAVGGILGDAASFYLGKKGTKWFGSHNKFFKTEYLKKGEDFFLKHGNRSVIFARFFGPLRPIIPFVAGMFKMPSQKFFLYNVISAAVSAPLYVGLGFFLGSASGQVEKIIGRVGLLILAITISITAIFYFKKSISRMGQDFFAQLAAFIKAVFTYLHHNFTQVGFVRHHPKGINFLRHRVTNQKITGFPLTLMFVLMLIIMLFWGGILKGVSDSPRINHTDVFVSKALFDARENNVVKLFWITTYFGSVWVLLPLSVFSTVLLWIKKEYQYIAPFIFCIFGGTGMVLILKLITGRPRPTLAPIYQERLFSFPSLHSFGALLIYGFIAYIVVSITHKWQQKINCIFLAVLVVSAVGFSRLYLGVHFLSDVIAGYILAGLWLLLGISLTKIFKRKKEYIS
jgi:undecaprenyl-diphosphatase